MCRTLVTLVLLPIWTLLLVQIEAQLCSRCQCGLRTHPQSKIPVRWADCAWNGLEQVPILAPEPVNVLDLSFNKITKLTKISGPGLVELTLCHNNINTIDDAFGHDLSNLEKLDLSHNNITTVSGACFDDLKQLNYVDLSHNVLTVLPPGLLTPLSRLKYLDLSYNDLGEWLMQSAGALNLLGLNATITDLKLDNLGLEELHSSYFDNYTNLKYLSLADNEFEDVPNVPYSVQYLDLSGTRLTVLQAKHLNYHSLKVLKLDRLKMLKSIHRYAFYNLQALEEVSIKYCNNLDQFNAEIFGVLSKETLLPLKKLSLRGNSLKSLNYTYKYLVDHLSHLDLSLNPWKCTCDLLWLKEYKHFLHNEQAIRCSSPRDLQNKDLGELKDEDTPNCFPEKFGKRTHKVMIAVLLTLIIVLSILIAYLIIYAPSWKGGSRLGPQSPYNPTRLEED